MSADELFSVGYVARAHGLRGELGIRTFDPGSTALDEAQKVVLRRKDGTEARFEIAQVREGTKELLVVLEGVGDRGAAEAWVGSAVFVRRDELEPPEEGEFFTGDLVGLRAIDEQGRALGTVEEVWTFTPVPNLVIREGKTELVIPFADEFVPKVDVEAKLVVVRPYELAD